MTALVRAVVVGRGDGTLAALRRQTRPPERIEAHGGPWHAALAPGGEPWLWLLEGGVVPEPDALAALLAALERAGGLPAPVLLASRIVGPDGALDRGGAPWVPLHDRRVVIAAAARGLGSVRLARWGSLLVAAEALDRHGPPLAAYAGGADDLEWTARLLRDAPGYLVPGSVVRRPAPVRRGVREARDRARLLRSPAWAPQEALWFAYTSAGQALRSGRRPSRRPRATVRRLSALQRFTRR